MQPKIILCDCDGVLTDGTLNIDHTGTKMFKSFHTRDVRAIRELIANGYEFYIVTADDWEGTEAFAEKVGAGFIYARDKGAVEFKESFIMVGDDVWDIQLMHKATMCYCPNDAVNIVKSHCKALNTNAGKGVIAELAEILLK